MRFIIESKSLLYYLFNSSAQSEIKYLYAPNENALNQFSKCIVNNVKIDNGTIMEGGKIIGTNAEMHNNHKVTWIKCITKKWNSFYKQYVIISAEKLLESEYKSAIKTAIEFVYVMWYESNLRSYYKYHFLRKNYCIEYNKIINKCVELVYPDIIELKNLTMLNILDIIKDNQTILFDTIDNMTDDYNERYRPLLNIMSKPNIVCSVDNTIDNATGIPNIIRVEMPMLVSVHASDITPAIISMMKKYIWHYMKMSNSKKLIAAYDMRKFFKIDSMFLTNDKTLCILLSLKSDNNCNV